MLSGGGSDVLGMACVFGALQSLLCDKGARQRRLPAEELCHLRRGSDIPGVLEVKLAPAPPRLSPPLASMAASPRGDSQMPRICSASSEDREG